MSGNTTTDDLYSTISFSFTADAIGDASLIGKDLAIRIEGATNSAIIDNVSVSFDVFVPPVREPSTAFMAGFNCLA